MDLKYFILYNIPVKVAQTLPPCISVEDMAAVLEVIYANVRIYMFACVRCVFLR